MKKILTTLLIIISLQSFGQSRNVYTGSTTSSKGKVFFYDTCFANLKKPFLPQQTILTTVLNGQKVDDDINDPFITKHYVVCLDSACFIKPFANTQVEIKKKTSNQ